MFSTVATQSRSASLTASFRVRLPESHGLHVGAQQAHAEDVQLLALRRRRRPCTPRTPCRSAPPRWPWRHRAGRRPSRPPAGSCPCAWPAAPGPATLLILCEPVWLRSSRLRSSRQPSSAPRRCGTRSAATAGRRSWCSSSSSSARKAGSAHAVAEGRLELLAGRASATRARTGRRTRRSGRRRLGSAITMAHSSCARLSAVAAVVTPRPASRRGRGRRRARPGRGAHGTNVRTTGLELGSLRPGLGSTPGGHVDAPRASPPRWRRRRCRG